MELCKRCLLLESAQKDVWQDIQKHIAAIDLSEKAETDLYQHRLSQCKSCEFLRSGICLRCGCYVEFRAAFRNKKCPDPANRKW